MQKVAKQRTQVKELPDCDLCGNTAKYDAPTVQGSWAYMCQDCMNKYGKNSQGSKLVKIKDKKPKKDYKETPTVTVPMSLDSVITVNCPWCDQPRNVEPDANYTVVCEACKKEYRVRSLI